MGARLGAFLSFLAVLAALLAPLSLLAEEVRTGKLGGICSASTALAGHGDDGPGQAPFAHGHCNGCGSSVLALPPLPASGIPCFPGFEVADLALPADLPATITGLPFSRGPPRL